MEILVIQATLRQGGFTYIIDKRTVSEKEKTYVDTKGNTFRKSDKLYVTSRLKNDLLSIPVLTYKTWCEPNEVEDAKGILKQAILTQLLSIKTNVDVLMKAALVGKGN